MELERIVSRRLHGQPLVLNLVTSSLRDHLSSHAPYKALLLSFHGPPGVGKNYISGMIAGALFEGGLQSPYVHYYSATRHFMHKDEEHIMQYKDKLHQEIPEKVQSCEHSLFIFDEMDKMAQNLIDTIKPFVDEIAHVDEIDFRKTVFLFLSNTAAEPIVDKALELRRNGVDRESFALKDFEQIIIKNALGEQPWCPNIRIEGLQGEAGGNYVKTETRADRPVYKHEKAEFYLFFDGSSWRVAVEQRDAASTLAVLEDKMMRPEESEKYWKVSRGGSWEEVPEIRITCRDAPPAGGPHVCTEIKKYPCIEKVTEEHTYTCYFFWTCTSPPTYRKATCSHTQYYCCDGFMQRDKECVKGTGFWQAELLSHNLVNHVVPFLPLEREHIELCARDVLLEKGLGHSITGAKLRQISDELSYLPKDGAIQYAVYGCRPVRSKVSMHIKL
ncbi:PREDICTED: torsin-1A-like [Branchiostoma belcheri]|uniref:Torsin-1A-like n=1 Tax=Branchiostoma belcheri TaxID=7741 RepID=A0A6P5A1H4_BRABE|nr:PREDICTED: torsin-1A-like [Branchiostoma belcheri]